MATVGGGDESPLGGGRPEGGTGRSTVHVAQAVVGAQSRTTSTEALAAAHSLTSQAGGVDGSLQ